MVKVVHVDDSKGQLQSVKKLMQKMDGVELVAQFDNAPDARAYLVANPVDILITDVEMPEYDGFWLAESVAKSNIAVVFLTAHSGYALRAFEACALNYILKPVTEAALAESVSRHHKYFKFDAGRPALTNDSQTEQIKELLSHYLNTQSYPKRIFVSNVRKISVLDLETVMYIQSQGAYTEIKVANEETKYVASKNLKVYAEILEGHPDFLRIHRSYIVNKRYLKSISREGHAMSAIMADDTVLEVSPLRKDEIYKQLVS